MWGLCWRELYREIVVWAETIRITHNRDMTLAWQTANLSHAKKLPPLTKYLVREPNPKTQTFAEQKSMLQMLSKRYGGKVRTVPMHG